MKNNNPLFSFLSYLKYVKKEYFIGVSLIILGTLAEIVGIKIASKMFNKTLSNLSPNVAFNLAMQLALMYIAVRLLEALFLFLRKSYLTKAGNIIYTKIQTYMYDYIQRLPIGYFDNIPAGAVLSRIVSDVSRIKIFFQYTLTITLVVIFNLIFILFNIVFIDYRIILFFMLIFPLIYIVQRIGTRLMTKYINLARKERTICSSLSNEMMQNLEVVNAFNNEEMILNNWKEHSNNRVKIDKKEALVSIFLIQNFFDLVEVLTKCFILAYYVYSEVYHLNLIRADEVVVIVFYITMIVNSIRNLMFNLNEFNRAKGAAANLLEILSLDIESPVKLEEVENLRGDVVFDNVSFAYNGENYVLKDINIEIKENQTVAFVGHTGSGKSTIMNLLVKFYENQKGSIYVGGHNIKDVDNRSLRNNMSIVLQDSFLFSGTIASNVCEDKELAKKALETVGAKYIIDERGIDAQVLQDGSNFSSGEKQLISFARALARNPKILILDEATSNVDSKTEEIIQNGIKVLKKDRTTLIIAHRLSTIKDADKIYVLDKGRIVESGNHDQLVELNGIYASMVDEAK